MYSILCPCQAMYNTKGNFQAHTKSERKPGALLTHP